MDPPQISRDDPAPSEALLAARGLTVGFRPNPPVVRDLDLTLRRGEILGLAGESGCGKSLTALTLTGLLPPGAELLGGTTTLQGAGTLEALSPSERRRLRGGRIAMVFQQPGAALNPVFSIGFQIREALRTHRGLRGKAATKEAERLLEIVAMPDPRTRLRSYPHELSGGQQQRALLAIALAGEPEILLADEPTTALDVTIQAKILDLLRRLRDERGLTILLITHDLGAVAACCDRVAVMYAGRIVEEAPVDDFFADPRHPYSRALLASRPRLGDAEPPQSIPGRVPSPGAVPSGCAFAPRCEQARERCSQSPPWIRDGERGVRCVLAESVPKEIDP